MIIAFTDLLVYKGMASLDVVQWQNKVRTPFHWADTFPWLGFGVESS